MKRKYKAGSPVTSLDELKNLKIVYILPWHRAHPVAFFLSWQWRTVDNWVNAGKICRAVLLKDKPKELSWKN